MALTCGTRLGPYEITAQIGVGGMGEVYRAIDTNLKRAVAIKVLPESVAADQERLARFQREAEVLASLNHPNIAQIHGLEKSAGVTALVLELVEGPTLADRIAQGPIRLDEALPIAKQIADALEAAHERAIIHRDLKPANVKVRPDGTVKVLDFGLAKAGTGERASSDLSRSPTVTAGWTRDGVILGTAAYMSPEQARGKAVDKRTDIWAFGCVLYQMLTGRLAFPGDTVSDTIAAILDREPEWNALPGSTGQRVRDLLRRCLHKDPKRRLHDIADARIDIEEAQNESPTVASAMRRAPSRRERLAWLALTGVALIAAVAIWRLTQLTGSVPTAPEMRLEIATPPTVDPTSLAISPDGRNIVFVANSEGRSQLWRRRLDSVSSRPLPGTDFARHPFWSPDSRSVGFFSEGLLKRLDLDGGPVRALAKAPAGLGGSWSQAGTILFSTTRSSPLSRVSATGGEPAALTLLDGQQAGHSFPHFLPDGRHFLYYVRGSLEARGVYVGQLEGTESVRLLDVDSAAVYASSGHLLFVRQGVLFAHDFDPVRLELSGNPFSLAEQMTVDVPGSAALSASAAGPIAYRPHSSVRRQLAWFDRSGKETERVGDPEYAAAMQAPSLSPDGRRVAFYRRVSEGPDVWLLDVRRGVSTKFTFGAADEVFPIWSPHGNRIVFSSNASQVHNLYWKSTTGVGSEELLLQTPQFKHATDWSRDGRFLLYRSQDPKTGYDIWALPLDGDRKEFPLVQTSYEDRDAQWSPDGKWIAYQSNESGRFEVYVQAFPEARDKVAISTNGGAQVRWGRTGRELFYIALDDRLMAVPIRLDPTGETVDAGTPIPLFVTRVGGAVQSYMQQYMVSPDGPRFLMNTVTEETASPIMVILNWKPRS